MSDERADDNQRAAAERFIRAVFEHGAWHEVRALKAPERKGKPYRSTATAYHDDPATAAADAHTLDALEAAGVYVTINPVDPDCAARAYRRIKHKAENTTGDAEILRRRWFPIDLDPERPSGISATEAERVAALSLAERVRAELGGMGWPAPIYCSTPNGAHLLYRIDLPNNPDALDIVTRALAGLAARFDGAGVKVDKSLHNASRILRIPGTTGRKGDSTPERPHRRGELRDVPAELVPVSRELLEAVATPKPGATSQRTTTPPLTSKGALHAPVNASATFERYDPTPDGLRSYLERHGVSVLRTRADGDGTMLDLRECPIAGSAGGTSVSVRIGADGLVTYHNLHNGGAGLIWADVREHLEPGYRAHSEGMKDRRDTGDPFDALPDATAPANPDEPAAWEDPIPFDAPLSLPAIPIEALPENVAEFVREVAASFEVHPDLPAACVLGVAAAACQKKYRVHVNGDHYEPTNLNPTPVAGPGERKSGVLPFVLKPLFDYEDELREKKRPEVARAQMEHSVNVERQKVLHGQAANGKDADKRSAALTELQELAEKMAEPPVLPMLTIGADVTSEALASLLNQHGGRITICDAEGGRLFANAGGHYSNGSPNIEVLLAGHAGDLLKVHRKGGGEIVVKHPAVTTIIAVQPDVVRTLAGVFKSRGLAGRILYVFPRTMAGNREYGGQAVRDFVRADYETTIRAMLELEPAKDRDGNELPHLLKFSADAYAVQQEMSRAIDRQMRPGEPLAEMHDWGSKAPGAAARVAGLLHVLEHAQHGAIVRSVHSVLKDENTTRGNPPLSRISICNTTDNGTERTKHDVSDCSCGGRAELVPILSSTVTRAWDIITCLKEHARHAYALMAVDAGGEFSREVLTWLRDRRPEGGSKDDGLEFDTNKKIVVFSKRACLRRFRSHGKERGPALRALEEQGFIRHLTERKAGRPSEKYEVNPLWAR